MDNDYSLSTATRQYDMEGQERDSQAVSDLEIGSVKNPDAQTLTTRTVTTGSNGQTISSESETQSKQERQSRATGTKEEPQEDLSFVHKKITIGDLSRETEKLIHPVYDRSKLFTGLKELDDFIRSYGEGYDDEKARTLNEISDNISGTMSSLVDYLKESQQTIESLRAPIADVTSILSKKVEMITKGTVKDSADVCLLDVQQKMLGQQLAALNDELISASKQTAEAEFAAIEAQRICAEACSIADKIRQDAEHKKREMAELAHLKELERLRLLELELKEKKRLEELEALEKRRELDFQEDAYVWPTFPLPIDSMADFDGGIGCLVKTDPDILRDTDITCTILDRNLIDYDFLEDEELVGHVLMLTITNSQCQDGAMTVNPGLCISIPHCMPKQQGNTREVVVKVQGHEELEWMELKTGDKTFETYKDIRFAQAQTRYIGKFVVVSRNKRSLIRMGRRGGKFETTLDSKVSFVVPSDALGKAEKLTIQLHQVESANIKFLKKSLVSAHNLISTSALFKLGWVNTAFDAPIKMTVPLPPNPAVLKKLSKVKAAKDEDSKSSARQSKMDTESRRDATSDATTRLGDQSIQEQDEHDSKASVVHIPISWYLGIYDLESEDDSDHIFLLRRKKDKWISENVPVERKSLPDVVEVTMKEPMDNFILFRTTTRLNAKDAEMMMAHLDRMMVGKFAHFIIGQSVENPYQVAAAIIPYAKLDKYVVSITERAMTPLYTKDAVFLLAEGEYVVVDFRGNVCSSDHSLGLIRRFFVNFECASALTLKERDIFVQKCYEVYRGFVRLSRLKATSNAAMSVYCSTVLLDEHLVTLPKNRELLAGKPVARANVVYTDNVHDLKMDALVKLSNEMDKEWLELGAALGLSQVQLYTIESNANQQKKSSSAKVLDMLKSWIKVQYRLSNKLDVLCAALVKINRPELAKIFQMTPGNFDEESMKTDHTDMSKGSWPQD